MSEASAPAAKAKKRRRWPLLLSGCLLLVALVVIGVGYVLKSLHDVPQFYEEARASLASAEVREEKAQEFEALTEELLEAVESNEGEWEQAFTQDQINAWLMEGLPRLPEKVLPRGVKDPLVELSEGQIRLGCFVELKQYRGIVSLDVTPAVASGDEIEFRIDHLRAGDMDLPASGLIDQYRGRLDRLDVPVRLEREGDTDRLVLDLERAAPRWRNFEIRDIKTGNGWIVLRGQARDASGDVNSTAEQPDPRSALRL